MDMKKLTLWAAVVFLAYFTATAIALALAGPTEAAW
jgi:hypothetical protein